MQQVLVLDEVTCARLLEGPAMIERLADGFVALSAGEVVAPTRIDVNSGSGYSLAMPAYRAGGHVRKDSGLRMLAALNAIDLDRCASLRAPRI